MKILIALAFAAMMIIVAFGVSNGRIEANAGSWLVFILPAIAVSLMGRSKCGMPFAKGER